MIDLSIIVVSWNTRELVLDCLASIERARAKSSLSSEVWVVDNASHDGTDRAVRERFPDVRLVVLPDNLGFAGGCNAGIREASGRHLLLLNSDTLLGDDVLERCVGYLDANPDTAIVGPQLRNPDGSKQNSVHNFPIVATELIPKGVFQYFFRHRFPSRRWAGDEPIEVESLLGAALFVRAEAIRGVGGPSEDYFFFLEETDWCWRMKCAGWRVVHLPEVSVIHVSGASSKKKNAALTRIEYHRSLYRYYRKHRGTGWMATVMSLRVAKTLFYVLTQAPLAMLGGRHRARWKMHRDVLWWHLRGCPRAVGIAQLGGPPIRTTAAS